MNNHNSFIRPQWSSMTSYLLVTTGAVVGLGNIFQFPYYLSKFGGLFLLLYVLCELFVSIPILLAELFIGRRGKQNPVGSISIISMEVGANRHWRWIGWLCFFILVLSLADYTSMVAFPVAYLSSILEPTTHINFNLLSHFNLEVCLFVFLFATLLVILRGINRGLETISRITVPAYFIILLGLAIYSCVNGSFTAALNYLFTLQSDQSFYSIFFAALTYAFFKLNVGMGSMIVYGSYLPYSVPIGKSTFIVVCFDAIISLLAYFVLYPLSMHSPELLSTSSHYFTNVLSIFSTVPNGNILSGLFFAAAIIAAWTPTIAMAESATVTLIERFNLPRYAAALIIFMLAILVGTAIIFSYHTQYLLFNRWDIIGFVNTLDSKILIPISALLVAIFAGWIITRQVTESALGFNVMMYRIWSFLIRFIAPIVIVGILVIVHW